MIEKEQFKSNNFPINYRFCKIEKMPEELKTLKENPYFIFSKFHQTKKYTPLGFFKQISIEFPMKNNSEL